MEGDWQKRKDAAAACVEFGEGESNEVTVTFYVIVTLGIARLGVGKEVSPMRFLKNLGFNLFKHREIIC